MTMNTENLRDDRLIKAILRAAEPTEELSAHPDEETLALFGLGGLDDASRTEVVRHLASCARCRMAGSLFISISAPQPSRVPVIIWLAARPRRWIATAACVTILAGLGLLFLRKDGTVGADRAAYAQAERLLRYGKFDEVRAVVARAARSGINTEGLRNLDAQAAREMPGPVALSFAGRLTDYGLAIGGIATRGPAKGAASRGAKAAIDILKDSKLYDTQTSLNRGQALLALNRPRDALAAFEEATTHSPDEPLAWLGVGLASFLLDDFHGAERAFKCCLDLEPASIPARINLAMTFEEEENWQQALGVWEKLLSEPLPKDEQQNIRRAIDEIHRQLKS